MKPTVLSGYPTRRAECSARLHAERSALRQFSLLLNDKVLVPITGSGWGDDAIASYEAALPGYEILGFSGS